MENRSRIEKLIKYVKGIKDKENGRELYLEYKEEIEQVKPQDDDAYRGVLEVSQDITEIKSLEGKRRLLNWGN